MGKEQTPESRRDAGPAVTRSLAGAADRLRESARWLVISFGAVAAVVFAGITVSRFGELDPQAAPGLFTLALTGAVLSLGGALGAMLVAMSLAAASVISLQQLLAGGRGPTAAAAGAVAADPLLSPWDNNLATFAGDLRRAHDVYQGELRSWRNDVARGTEYVDRAAVRLIALTQTQQEIQDAASFLRLKARFDVSRWWLGCLLAVAAAGAIAFAWATSPAASESVPDELRAATWAVADDDRARVSEALGGSACDHDLAALPVVILSADEDGKEVDVVTVPSAACAAVRLVVAAHELRVDPRPLR